MLKRLSLVGICLSFCLKDLKSVKQAANELKLIGVTPARADAYGKVLKRKAGEYVFTKVRPWA